MQHTTVVLRQEHEIVKQVMVLALSRTVVVFALERDEGVLVGTHSFIHESAAPEMLGRLGSVFNVG